MLQILEADVSDGVHPGESHMRLNWLALTARLAAASLAMLPALNAPAGQTSVNVTVSATLIPSSGVCNTINGGSAVGVTCGGPGTVPVPPPVMPPAPPAPSPGVPGPPMPPPGDGDRGGLPTFPPPIATPGPTVPGGNGAPIPFPGSPPGPSGPPPTSVAQLQQGMPQVLAGFNSTRELRYVGTVGLAGDGFALFSASAEITSWRVVSLDNGNYVELTIAW